MRTRGAEDWKGGRFKDMNGRMWRIDAHGGRVRVGLSLQTGAAARVAMGGVRGSVSLRKRGKVTFGSMGWGLNWWSPWSGYVVVYNGCTNDRFTSLTKALYSPWAKVTARPLRIIMQDIANRKRSIIVTFTACFLELRRRPKAYLFLLWSFLTARHYIVA